MALENYIKPGQKLDIKAFKRTRLKDDPNNKTYTSKVYDVMSEDQIEILMPTEQQKLILLPVDGEFQLVFYTESGLYECIGRIIERYKSNNVYILLIEIETNLRKYQRREYYRYNCIMDMFIRDFEEGEVDEAGNILGDGELDLEKSMQKATIVDISGGGIRFVAPFAYKRGDLVLVRYKLYVKGRFKEYNIISRILEVRRLESTGRSGYQHRVQYMHISIRDREEIIQYIFDEERKNRQKERGL